ncbi:MAG: serpin family protein [Parachlamydiaceae bacterium]|nr:serpin family protein [Parachlamydiaceae bacterium]
MNYFLICYALLATLLLDAQSPQNDGNQANKKTEINLPSMNQGQSLVLASNNLGFQIFQEIKNGEENLVFSPYSLSIGLGMVYAGADGSTQSQMARVLRFPLRGDSIGPSFNLLTKTVTKDPRKLNDDLSLSIANSLWIQHGHPILPLFSKSIANDFRGQLKNVDFTSHAEEARIEINTWIKERTQGKIPQLFDRGEIPNITRMLLISTIYMRGKWLKPFNEDFTRQTPFYPHESKSMTVPMMTVTGTFSYLKGSDFSIVELPYDSRNSEGLDVSMYVILPKDIFGLSMFEKKINEQNLQSWISKMAPTQLIISMPKFKIVSAFSFDGILAKMGMVAPFSDNADFSKINGLQDLKISKIVQKSYIMVNEKGTEAAAAAGIIAVSKSAVIGSSEIFLVDHPFMFFILDKTSGGILFMGKVTQPQF